MCIAYGLEPSSMFFAAKNHCEAADGTALHRQEGVHPVFNLQNFRRKFRDLMDALNVHRVWARTEQYVFRREKPLRGGFSRGSPKTHRF